MTPLWPLLVVMALVSAAALAVVFRLGVAAFPKWGGWFPEIHPEDRAFCHRCGGRFTPGAMYDAHMRACK